MTILTAFDQASKLLRKGAKTSLVSSTDPFAVEMLAIANEAAPEIAKRHDWQKLLTLKTHTGDAATTAFTLPTDFDRMPVKAKIFEGASAQPMAHVIDWDQWLYNRLQSFAGAVHEWTLLGGSLHIFPVMSASETAKYYYITNLIVDPASGDNKTSFTIDTDTFVLPERLLMLAMVYKWRQMIGQDFSQDMDNFELALSQEITRDKGSRIIKIGMPRIPDGVNIAFHGTITA